MNEAEENNKHQKRTTLGFDEHSQCEREPKQSRQTQVRKLPRCEPVASFPKRIFSMMKGNDYTALRRSSSHITRRIPAAVSRPPNMSAWPVTDGTPVTHIKPLWYVETRCRPSHVIVQTMAVWASAAGWPTSTWQPAGCDSTSCQLLMSGILSLYSLLSGLTL